MQNSKGNIVPHRLLPQSSLSRKSGKLTYRSVLLAIIGAALLLPALLASGSIRTASTKPAGRGPCASIQAFAGSQKDAGPAFRGCLEQTPAGGTIALPPGQYLIATPVRITRPVILRTKDSGDAAPPCFADEKRCAVLHFSVSPDGVAGAVMPFDINSSNVRLDRLIFEGARLSDPALTARLCSSDKERPLAGGLRINGNDNSITRSIFRNMGCYTALEYGGGENVVISNNLFSSNGTHNIQSRWADGLTIHSGNGFQVTDNRFHDNTDVQLIFGGCINCTVKNNRFSHSARAGGGSFAELMLQAWPKATSGDYTGTRVTGNRIDCGAERRCGFGIMIGSAPWYDAPAYGGSVTDNVVRGAMLALNVDKLTGPMVIERNNLNSSSGTYPSMCGPHSLQGVMANISPASRPFLSQYPTDGISLAHYCILNFKIGP
ncbi:right-handed parallel beta-helix repeat-containing protein [Sphingobium sp. PAMC28499]|uniref:right-handed parallel beta-helix repeat-containing protein n=1 Tax=Sphingobium sp. PAMC28499 TaxID=2565554 RepID=UPI00144831BB|nr:right-handed parallel beta-helix repeat-containing protein [Sphingobium sp. PAMC28499]